MAQINDDVTGVEPNKAFEIIPPGDYIAQVVESDVKDTKASDGQYMKLTWQILDGEHEGRKVFDNITLRNPNQQAQEIGARDRAALYQALGLGTQVQNTEELHGIPCTIKVKVRPAKGDYAASNEVKGYVAIEQQGRAPVAGNTAPRQQQAPVQQRSTAPAASSSQPVWKRPK